MGSALGIASAFLLVIFFSAVFRGESVQIIAYPNNIKPDVWVMQTGVGNMYMAASFIWDWKAARIEAMAGVKRVTPILYLNTVVNAGGQESFAFIVGLLPNSKRAGPWEMATGRQIKNPGEAVIPDVLSDLTGVGIGDSIAITDRSFKVVLALVVVPHIPSFVPQLTLVVSFSAIARIGLVTLLVALLVSLIPAYMVTRLDPQTAFHV
ncbi:MAG: ABC transporter permease [Desulfobacteraceae bacterium]|nr:MAG: ABC transporter permease [Desulfobacteraceae bacterium]